MRSRVITLVVAALALVLHAAPARAFSSGIASTVFETTGCPLCHAGGTPPTVLLSGPTSVAPDSTVEYTFTVFGDDLQRHGGFNVAAPLGVLTTGGPFAGGTQSIPGLLGRAEITHISPKQGDFLNVVEFSFLWTAPSDFTSVTLRAWGNAVDDSHSPNGDAARLATLQVFSSAADTPTPTDTPDPAATPTASPPAITCGDAESLSPPLIVDPAARACQAAIAKAGAGYVKKYHKAVRQCLATWQAGAGDGDPIAACVGSASAAPTDPETAAAIGAARAKALELLQKKCPNSALAPLDACADTEPALETCFFAQHRQVVIDAVASQYGALTPSADKGVRKCQQAIGAAAANHLLAHLRASQKCLARRNKAANAVDGAALCVGALSDNVFAPPLDPKAASAAVTGAAKLGLKIEAKCTDEQLAALATCGSDRASALACLLCDQRTAIFALISAEFGGQ